VRSTLEIICAVKDSQPVTEEELRMALLVMSSINYFNKRQVENLTKAFGQDTKESIRKFTIHDADGHEDRMVKIMKGDMIVVLGPGNIPGTPEYEARMKMNRDILKKATGIEL
jgi:hypothetical protein